MVQLQRRLAKLEHRAAVAEGNPLLLIVRSYGRADDPAVDADIDALKAAGFLRGGAVRVFTILDTGEIEGLSDRERQFLRERRGTS